MSCKRFFSLLVLLFALSGKANTSFANPAEEKAGTEAAPEKKKLNVAGDIFGHVGDSHEWHFFSVGEHHVTLPLPVIAYSPTAGLSIFSSSHFENRTEDEARKLEVSNSYNGYHLEKAIKEKLVADDGSKVYDFSITKNVLSMMLSVVILLLLMTGAAKKYRKNGVMKAPTGFQNALEPVITFLRDEVAKPNLGFRYVRYMPLLLTIFFFIWINNLLGLLPGGANFTGNVAVTGCFALISFVVMMASSNKHFWSHLLNPPGVPGWVKPLLVLIEIMSLFIKPVALVIRLFANILAGHIVILSVVFMIFIFGNITHVAGWGFSPLSMAFAIFMFMLELLVGAIQAFIFANLTAVFIGQAIEEPHHHDDPHHHHGEAVNDETGQYYHVSDKEIIA